MVTDSSPTDNRLTSNWARLIQKVYEVDPREYTHCGATMRIIARPATMKSPSKT